MHFENTHIWRKMWKWGEEEIASSLRIESAKSIVEIHWSHSRAYQIYHSPLPQNEMKSKKERIKRGEIIKIIMKYKTIKTH